MSLKMQGMEKKQNTDLLNMAPEVGCGCNDAAGACTGTATAEKKTLNVELLVIDLTSCKRCVPTGNELKRAVGLLAPVAEVLGIELNYREAIVRTEQEAKALALMSSPTIRLNGRDIVPDIRESLCESCCDLTEDGTLVNCREWHYRGKIYYAAPLPLLTEAIMRAMLDIDTPPVVPESMAVLPENLRRYFDHKRPVTSSY